MYVSLGVFLIVLAILFHEAGHALAMRRHGIVVSELGIGLPFGPRIEIESEFLKRLFGERFRLVFTLALIGAYVLARDIAFEERLTLSQRCHIYGAGVIGNLVFIMVIWTVLVALIFLLPGQFPGITPDPLKGILIIVAASGACFLLVVFSRQISQWIFPIISMVAIILLAKWIFNAPMTEFANAMGGPVLLGKITADMSTDLVNTLLFGAFISFGIGVTNLLPFWPLDGGQIIQAIAEAHIPGGLARFTKYLGAFLTGVLVIGSLGADIIRLIVR